MGATRREKLAAALGVSYLTLSQCIMLGLMEHRAKFIRSMHLVSAQELILLNVNFKIGIEFVLFVVVVVQFNGCISKA